MFTGIVEGVGKVISLDEEEQSWCFKLDLPFQDRDGLEPGASLAVNGCCLTFREQAEKIGTFDLLEETTLVASLFFLIPLAIEEPINPHPIIHTLLNITLRCSP